MSPMSAAYMVQQLSDKMLTLEGAAAASHKLLSDTQVGDDAVT